MNKNHLSVLGVGPIYVAIIVMTTIFIVLLQLNHIIPTYKIPVDFLAIIIGIVFIVIGIVLWINAVVFSKLTSKIKSNTLVTSGVFSYVRNPIYSAFMFICTGIIVSLNNILLFFVPILYWILLTILLINTEEKWLRNLYKQDYETYCNKVNRCIPMIRKS